MTDANGALLIYEDLPNVCRACLGKSGTMRPLFGTCLDTMLMAVAEIKVFRGDGLPEFMCVQCVLQVSRAFTFKQKCQKTDLSLRNFLQNIEKFDAQNVYTTEAEPDPEREYDINDEDSFVETNEEIINVNTSIVEPVQVQFQENELGEKCLFIVQTIPEILNDNVQNIDLSVEGARIVENIILEEHVESELQTTNEIVHLSYSNEDNVEEASNSFPSVDLISDEFESFSNEELPQETVTFETIELTKISCSICGDQMSNNDELKLHIKRRHPPPNKHFECNICGKVFNENKILKRHLKIHSAIKPHVCTTCDKSFAESSNLNKHKKKHTGELRNIVGKPNLCTVCGKRFKWASSLSKHMKHHTKHKILNCPHCPKYYVEARSLNIHIRSHTGEKPFVCKICKKAFTQLGNLEKHLRVHTGEKPFLCPVCGKGFSQSGYVTIHVRTHTGERPYECNDCGRKFAGSNTLAIHKRTHTGERPYPCGICDKSFARQETAIIHQRTHTGEKPHVCKICHRGFSSSGHLTGHLRSHEGIKPHACTICKKRFAGGTSLKSHMKTHTTTTVEKPNTIDTLIDDFECQMCNQKYSTLKALQKHEIVEHAITITDDDLVLKSDAILMSDEMIVNENDLIVVEQASQ